MCQHTKIRSETHEDEKNVDSIVSMQQKSMFLFQNSEIIIIYCGGNIGERGYTLMLDRWKGMQLTSDQEALVNEMLSDLDKCDQGLVNKWRAEGHSDYWIAISGSTRSRNHFSVTLWRYSEKDKNDRDNMEQSY